MPQPLHGPDDPMAAHLTALYDRVARLERRPISSPFSPQFCDFRIAGQSFTLWPFGAVEVKGNISLSPQMEILDHITIRANASVGSKVVIVHDQFGSVTSTIEFSVIALTGTDGVTPIAPLEVCGFRLDTTHDSTGTGGGDVPFDTVDLVDGTYFTSQDNGDGTFSPVMQKSGLYLITLWVVAG